VHESLLEQDLIEEAKQAGSTQIENIELPKTANRTVRRQ